MFIPSSGWEILTVGQAQIDRIEIVALLFNLTELETCPLAFLLRKKS